MKLCDFEIGLDKPFA